MIKVFHFNHDNAENSESANVFMGWKTPKFNNKNYDLVAEVDTNDEDEAYYLTNHVEFPWHENFKVKPIGGTKHRSTSVGDVIELADGTKKICRPMGWEVI